MTETLTFLFTDIEGSTRMLSRLGATAYAAVLEDHHGLVRSELRNHDGREVSTQGDGFFAVFTSPGACVAATIAMQRSLDAHRWSAGERVRVRMGLHAGEASQTATGLVGLDVHRAARVAAVAHGGQILLSETAAALVADSLPGDASLRDLGLHRLKDLGRAERIFQLEAPGLEVDFPPIATLDRARLAHNLPSQPAPFIGRHHELKEVCELVATSRLVTLTGAGGSGKTRLALQVATDLIGMCADGVWLVELASISNPHAVTSATAQAIGISDRSAHSAVDALTVTIGQQDMFFVFDNCEHVIDACAQVIDTIVRNCPHARVMTTSREPLGIGGETIYRVPSLSLPGADDSSATVFEDSDAVALFVERARSQGIELASDAVTIRLVVSTCRRLDGMPLAIELAAARLRSLPLAELHSLLDQRFSLLTGGSRSALERQQTLRATVDWSYSLLDEREQSVLRRLSVFVEGFDLSAARAVCGFDGIESFDVTDLLGSLVDKSLVMAEPSEGSLRYRLLETIRQFAAELLVAGAGDEARHVATAHCHYFLTLAEEAADHLHGRSQPVWLALLTKDEANLRRAIEHAAGDEDKAVLVLRFAVALRFFWSARSKAGEVLPLLRPVLDTPLEGADPALVLEATIAIAMMARAVDIGSAGRLGERAVELAAGVDDERLSIWAQVALGGTKYFSGDYEHAFILGSQSLDRARLVGDDTLLAVTVSLCAMASKVVAPSQTASFFAEASACADRTGNLFFTADIHNTAGLYALDDGDVAEARRHLEKAAAAQELAGLHMHHISINLGVIAWAEGDIAGARTMLVDALHICRRNGDRFGIAYVMLGFATIDGDRDRWRRAAQLHGAAQSYLEQIGQPWLLYYGQMRESSIDEGRAVLGETEFNRWYAQGMAMSVDEAFDLALAPEFDGADA